jgi:hypothetical protein
MNVQLPNGGWVCGIDAEGLAQLQKDIDEHPEKYKRGEWKPSLIDKLLMFVGIPVLSERQP